MKIIEAMKKIKDLQLKANDLRDKLKKFGSDLDFESVYYGSEQQQREQIASWLQAHSDIVREIANLRVAIQRTNIATQVTIELGDKQITKSIAYWIHRRRDLAKLELDAWNAVGAKPLQEGRTKNSSGDEVKVQIRRYFNPSERDSKMELYRSEPSKIDATLEIINATTDLIEND